MCIPTRISGHLSSAGCFSWLHTHFGLPSWETLADCALLRPILCMRAISDSLLLSSSEFAMETSVHRPCKAVNTAASPRTATPVPYTMHAVYGKNFSAQPLRDCFPVFVSFFPQKTIKRNGRVFLATLIILISAVLPLPSAAGLQQGTRECQKPKGHQYPKTIIGGYRGYVGLEA